MSDYSVGPMNLLKSIAVNGMVPIRHVDGLPSGWEYQTMEDGNQRAVPVYNPRLHEFMVPEMFFSVRTATNGRQYLMLNTNWNRTDRPDLQANPDIWEIVRCVGTRATLVITVSKALAEPVTLTVACRNTPVVIPAGQTQVTIVLDNCMDAVNANKPVGIVSIDSEDVVDPSIFTLNLEITTPGRLMTGQSKIIPSWSK